MKQSELVATLRQGTELVPTGARARVWQKLQAPRPASAWRPVLAFAAALAVGFTGAGLALRARHHSVAAPPFRGDSFALVALPGAVVTPKGGGTFELRRGALAASSWGTRLSVSAAGKTVVTEAGRFTVEVAADAVQISVSEGAVSVDGARVEAPGRWPTEGAPTVDDSAVRALEPKCAADDRAFRLAEDAAARGDVERALQRFSQVAQHDGLRAEAALLRQGQLLMWNRHDPAAALEVFGQGARRFPQGSLAQDTALSELEALAALARPELGTRAQAFLDRFPESERRAEVCRLGRLEKCER